MSDHDDEHDNNKSEGNSAIGISSDRVLSESSITDPWKPIGFSTSGNLPAQQDFGCKVPVRTIISHPLNTGPR